MSGPCQRCGDSFLCARHAREHYPERVTEEAELVLRASEVLDSMWYSRYHGGTSSGVQGHARWAALRSVANDIAEWRRRNGFDLTKARAQEARLERIAEKGGG